MLNDAILTIINAINAQHGLGLTLGERFASGEQGAFAVRAVTGTAYVLKLSAEAGALDRLQRAQIVTKHLRGLGYPAPSYHLNGVVEGLIYSLQEVLPGRPIEAIGMTHVARLVALNALQRGPASLPANDWPRPIIDSVLVGCDSYCVLESLDGYSRATRALLIHVQSLVTEHADVACPAGDIVHFDFNPANILIDDDQISGVVDWDGVMSGDRMFDLVTLLFYAGADRGTRQAIWQHLRTASTPGAISLYLAHIIVRQVDWSIRHHDADTIESWLGVADSLLKELASI